MAERRMFSKFIIDSDAFLDMPSSAQALYFHLAMRADDDGFVNCPKKIQRMVSSSDDDLKILLAKRFLIPFESGIVVIKHWRIHNYIQKDRYKPTVYQEELKRLTVKKNGAYTECIQPVSKMDSQVRLGKDSIGKDSINTSAPSEPAGEDLSTTLISSFKKSFHAITDDSSWNWPVQMKHIKGLVERCLKQDDPFVFAKRVMETYYSLVKSNDKFWNSQPLTPMNLNAEGIFSRVVAEMERVEQQKTAMEEVFGEHGIFGGKG